MTIHGLSLTPSKSVDYPPTPHRGIVKTTAYAITAVALIALVAQFIMSLSLVNPIALLSVALVSRLISKCLSSIVGSDEDYVSDTGELSIPPWGGLPDFNELMPPLPTLSPDPFSKALTLRKSYCNPSSRSPLFDSATRKYLFQGNPPGNPFDHGTEWPPFVSSFNYGMRTFPHSNGFDRGGFGRPSFDNAFLSPGLGMPSYYGGFGGGGVEGSSFGGLPAF